MKRLVAIVLVLSQSNAFANYSLLSKNTEIICTGSDSQEFRINRARTMIKWGTEGESLGFKKILTQKTDHRSFAEFTTEEVTVRLGAKKDTVYFNGDSGTVEEIDCR